MLAIFSTANRLKGYTPGQIIFGRDMILPINHKVDWGLMSQLNQVKINKDNIRKNNKNK